MSPGLKASTSDAASEVSRPPRTDGLRRALAGGVIDRDQYLVERADELFNPARTSRRFGRNSHRDTHSATTVLRDLALRLPRLEGTERRRAQRILARPTDGASDPQHHGYNVPSTSVQHSCNLETSGGKSLDLCVHWVDQSGNADAPDLTDSNTNFVPDYVELVQSTLHVVWEAEVGDYGYKPPLKDGSLPNDGPNSGIDIYLADIGEDGIYGYCTNDNPKKGSRSQFAYCVLDNDFSQDDFAPGTYGEDALRVTAAHEFFHAIQFAYDWREKKFFMEGTAVWMEDEVFDDVNANYAYLHDSPLHQPEIPIDAGNNRPGENFEYGSWLFWRFLAERFNSPALIRNVWVSAADSDVLKSLATELRSRNTNLSDVFAEFAVWNRTFNSVNTGLALYEEGVDYMASVAYRYPPLDAEFWLGPNRPSSGNRTLPLDHLSTRYIVFKPLTSIDDPNAKLKTSFDLPKASLGARARLLVTSGTWVTDHYEDYCTNTYKVSLNRNGDGAKTIPFWTIKCGGIDKDVLLVVVSFTNGGFKNDLIYKYKGVVIQ